MHVGMILEMASDSLADRVALGSRASDLTYAELARRARRAGTFLAQHACEHVVLVDLNSPAVPIGLFGAAIAGKPFVPVNYRLADDRLQAIIKRVTPCLVIAGDGVRERIGDIGGVEFIDRDAFLAVATDESIEETDGWGCDPDATAVLLFTSGTTGEPKAAVLRHRNLAAYLVTSLEFGAAGEDEANIVSVPPYHIASVSSVLSTTYTGRRVVQLEAFEPKEWVDAVRREGVTHAMVVPTMLNRILDVIDADSQGLPSLRSLAYGGGPMPQPVVERALGLLPGVDLVNAYGLTETSSTISVLGPDDHLMAFYSDDPAARARLGSVGKPLPGVEVEIRDGTIWVRGDQVSGEYEGVGSTTEGEGWFNTRDAGYMDDEGYLFVQGRVDDVIVRGGENLSPGEIESVLVEHPAVEAAAVVGIPDVEWGERVVAAVVKCSDCTEDELRDHVRAALRSANTPERIAFYDELPFNETGKLLRRVLRDELAQAFADA
ncbi:MAG TPA: class I adenylate-forming enzyme family protein [Acidimicrobiales bacterium]|nr:class I adenylate-forming enzyme family protein [Acidimicrobiales bacterium]